MLAFLRLRIGGSFLNFLLKRSVLILQGISAELNREKVNLTNHLILCKQRLVRGDTSASAEIIALEARLFALFSFEIEGVKMRSRACWIEEGEKPSRYFFRLEQERIEKNRVISM